MLVLKTTQIGKLAVEDREGHAAVPAFVETARDFKSFERRAGALPEQEVFTYLSLMTILGRYIFCFFVCTRAEFKPI